MTTLSWILVVVVSPGYVWLLVCFASNAYFREKLKYDKQLVHQAVDLTGDQQYEDPTDRGAATR